MNIWIDCEFNEFGGDLISMALVANDGQEFYEVLNLENDEKYGSWVYFNVVPYLNKEPIDKHVFQAKLWRFINQWDDVHIIADWPDDIKYFLESTNETHVQRYTDFLDDDAGDDYFVDKDAALEYIKILEAQAKELDKT